MSLWGRVRAAFSRRTETASAAAGSVTLGANVDGWRREARSGDGDARSNWAASAWDAYRIPEVRAAVNWLTNAMSRVRLYPAWIPDDNGDPQPIADGDPNAEALIAPVRELFGGPLQQAEMLRRWYLYRLVAGECIIAAVRPTMQERRDHAILDEWLWMVRDAAPMSGSSTSEITLSWRTRRGQVTRRVDPGDPGADVVLIHDRKTDPANPALPDSPTRAILDDAELMRNVADSINATSVSRIAGVQMLAATPGVTIPGFGSAAAPEDEDPVLAGLVDTMGQRVEHRRDPLVPIVFRTSDNEKSIGDQVMPVDLTSRYDERTLDILDWVSRRVAITYSVPVEVTNGTMDTNHWNALYDGQDGARIVIAPDAADFCRMLDECWVQWQRIARGVPASIVRTATIWYDASALVQDPDRSATMIALRQADPTLVTGQEVRRAVGLSGEPDEVDFAPTPAASAAAPPPDRSDPRLNSGQAAVASIPGSGRPVVRVPGYPTPPRVRAGPRA